MTLRLLLTATAVATATPTRRKNVLFVVSDDLRPELPCYGCDHVVAPRTTALAAESITFTRAYAQQSLCAPSRNSFLSGRRPAHTKSWQFRDDFREVGPDWTTLPGAFRKAGYQAVGTGKIFHPGLPPNEDLPYSWDTRINNTWADWSNPGEPRCPGNTSWCAVEKTGRLQFQDTQIAATALELLANVTRDETRPFFLAVGFRKPHLQWRAPRRAFDAYPQNVSLAARPQSPRNYVDLAFHIPVHESDMLSDWRECGGSQALTPRHNYADVCQQAWRRGYYAVVTFMDEQLGVVLDGVKARGRERDTVVVFFGDHGWHLGDQNEWMKMTLYENAVRVPLLIKVPWAPHSAGRVVTAPVELVDLFPTVAALAGVDTSYIARESKPLDGRDLSRLFYGGSGDHTHVARSVYPRCVANASAAWRHNDCNDTPRRKFTHMGYSTRDERWRFTAWYEWSHLRLAPKGSPVAVELYDHAGDVGRCDIAGGSALEDYEWANVAGDHKPVAEAQLARLSP